MPNRDAGLKPGTVYSGYGDDYDEINRVRRASVSPEQRALVQETLAPDHEARVEQRAARISAIEAALEILRNANKQIGFGVVLKESERSGLYLLGRIQQYLYTRLERGEEIFESEKRMAGDGVQRALIYLGKNGRI